MDPSQFAVEIDSAHRERRLLDAAARPHLHLSAAYEVQRRLTALRTARGAHPIGWKLGYTSAAMRRQMGIDQPNFGPLLDTMLIADGQVPDVFVQPRVEPEIALVLDHETRVGQALAALEIVDSVWRDYRFSVELNTADGSSAAGVVLGAALPLDTLDALAVHFRRNGATVDVATASAAMGHPLRAFDWLADALADYGGRLRPGDVVLTGGLTAAQPIEPGDIIEAVFGDDVSVRVHRVVD